MIKGLVKNYPAPVSAKDHLSLQEVCSFMKLRYNMVKYYMSQFGLPYHYHGKKIFFRKSEIQEWLATSDYSEEVYQPKLMYSRHSKYKAS